IGDGRRRAPSRMTRCTIIARRESPGWRWAWQASPRSASSSPGPFSPTATRTWSSASLPCCRPAAFRSDADERGTRFPPPPRSMAARRTEYSEASIRVLKGLEPVRQRPGMYTRTENPLHIVQEALDNAADEALAGFCKEIVVTLHADGSIEVDDDGRGIPVGKHPEEGVPVVEIVFTRLHAGGKFDKAHGGAYSFSGGLHGVGVSVSNALSKRFEVTVWRDGKVHRIAFAGGEVVERLRSKAAGKGERRSGTSVRMWPDPKYFDTLAIPHGELVHLLRSKAVLLPGVRVTLVEEKTG